MPWRLFPPFNVPFSIVAFVSLPENMVPSEVVALMTFPEGIVALTISLLTRVAFSTGLLIIFPFPLLKEDVST